MRIRGKIGTGVAVLGLVLGTAQVADAAPQQEQKQRRETTTITLITGDQVTMRDGNAVSVRPAKGREKVTFSRFRAGGHFYVLPNDARMLVSSGRLDERLFDLTTLTEFGYDDAHRDSVPLIVTHPAGQQSPRVAGVSRELPSINGVAMSADKSGAAWETLTDGTATRTTAAGVAKVWLDGKRKSTLDHSVPQIGAPAAWDAGFTGKGVKVAVLDCGVDETHPDLAGRQVAERNFTDAPDAVDRAGHGTHVASTIGGTGAKSGGKYRGVADGVSILDGKVLNDGGFGQDSWIIAGMEWAAQQGADIANLSLGGADTTAIDPMEEAVENLSAQYGILFVIAAGNSGPDARTVGSPGSAPSALTVGAVDRDDALAFFSSRGPTEVHDDIKPDITAPGVEIVAAKAANGFLGTPVADGYVSMSGTSMATPHVAGAAALLAEQHPDWTGQQLKAVLSGSAKPSAGVTEFEQGAGRVDVARAITQTVVSEPANLNLGIVAWPHDDDQAVSRTLTYRNLGTADVTLDLDLQGGDGVLALSADQVTVPAGGTAEVTVTGDTRLGTADRAYTGTVVATAGDSVTRTPVAITREVESYTLSLNYTDENGAPTGDYSAVLLDLDTGRVIFPYDADGSATVRVPKGRYFADHLVLTGGDHQNDLVQPGLNVDRDQTVTVDPRVAKPINVTTPAPATLALGDIGFQLEVGGSPVLVGGPIVFDLSTVSTAQLGDALPGMTVKAWVNTQWSGADGSFYGLAWFLDRFPTGYTRAVSRRELATVRADYGPGAAGDVAQQQMTPQPATGMALTLAYPLPVPLGGTRDEYVTTGGVRWQSAVVQLDANDGFVAQFLAPQRAYRAGRVYHESFNRPVFGPSLPPKGFPWVYRIGDVIVVDVWLFGDKAGNAGLSTLESASTKLYRGDELVGETPVDGFGVFEVPAEAGDYRLTTSAVRPARFDLTTSISAEWTFSSSHVDGEEPAALDLNVVRFLPRLDANGAAPAGRRFDVPLEVQDETGTAQRPRRLTVEASFDEGRTWQRVTVTKDLVAKVNHPAGATSVSLRASATDRDGNTVKQTVIRAYKLR